MWIAQIVSIFGDFLAVFAVISVVTFQLHGTPTQASMILAAYMAPLAVISPLAGVYVAQSVAIRATAPPGGLMSVNALTVVSGLMVQALGANSSSPIR